MRTIAADGGSSRTRCPTRAPRRRHRATGRPRGRVPGSRRFLADATAKDGGRRISPAEQRRLERHIEFAERFPFLQRTENGWTLGTVLRAAPLLAQLPASCHPMLAPLFDRDDVPASVGLRMLQNLVDMPESYRRWIARKVERDATPRSAKKAVALTRDALPPDRLGPALTNMARLGRRVLRAAQADLFWWWRGRSCWRAWRRRSRRSSGAAPRTPRGAASASRRGDGGSTRRRGRERA